MKLPPEQMRDALTNADVPLRYQNCRLNNFVPVTLGLKRHDDGKFASQVRRVAKRNRGRRFT
jgi:hypothetical protein